MFIVFYGARDAEVGDTALLQEVQMFISGGYVVTLHTDPLPALEEQRSRLAGQVLHSEQFLLYRVFDALTDSFFRRSRAWTTRSTSSRPRSWPGPTTSSCSGCSPSSAR